MLNKLQVLEDKYIDLTEKISDMEIINDQKVWQNERTCRFRAYR